jgi:hypothetical protein
MTWYDYRESKRFGADPNFYALIMAAMRKADTFNAIKLHTAFPDVWDEAYARYWAPGGVIAGDPPGLLERVAAGEIEAA